MFLPSKDNDRNIFNVPQAQHTGTRSYGLLRVSELKSQSMVMTRPKPCRYLSLGLGAAIFSLFCFPNVCFPAAPPHFPSKKLLLCFFHAFSGWYTLVCKPHLYSNSTLSARKSRQATHRPPKDKDEQKHTHEGLQPYYPFLVFIQIHT